MVDFLFGKDMKSYTDIPQSAKLAEILPIESADMFCADVLDMDRTHLYNFHILSTWGCKTFEELKDRENKFVHYAPCWSLAALLGILLCPSLRETFGGWRCDSYNKEGTSYILGKPSDNPVDACVDMILLLKERNLI